MAIGKMRKFVSRNKLVTKKTVRKMINSKLEAKYHDHEIGNISVNSVGVIQSISAAPQGDGVNQRVGDRINVFSFNIQLAFIRAVGDTFNTMRIIVFRWNNNSLTDLPTLDEILQPDSGLGSGILSPYRNYNHNSMKNGSVRILYDRLKTTDDEQRQIVTYKSTKRYKRPIKIQFNETVNSGKGKLYILMVSDSTASFHPSMRGLIRIQFRDG